MDLLVGQITKAAGKGYTAEHDAEHGPRRLIQASHAYTMNALVRTALSTPQRRAGRELWPMADGWNPDDDPAVTLAKAAQLLLAAADVILAEREQSGGAR